MGSRYGRWRILGRDMAWWRAAWWGVRACARVRRRVGGPDFGSGSLPPVPPVGRHATPAVLAVLARMRASCLVRSVVLQRWFLAHGEARQLVIGVTAPGDGFRAHAWLDGESEEDHRGLVELLRRPPGAESKGDPASRG